MTTEVITKRHGFIIKKIHPQRADFYVVEMGNLQKEQIRIFLENLPMRFHLKDRDSKDVYKPVEVYVDQRGMIVAIYPPKNSILVGASFQSWEFYDITKQMRVDNIMQDDLETKQIYSCVHFNPNILGVSDWPVVNMDLEEIELDIFKYPKR